MYGEYTTLVEIVANIKPTHPLTLCHSEREYIPQGILPTTRFLFTKSISTGITTRGVFEGRQHLRWL